MDLRTLADFRLRNRLLAVGGVAQVTVMGGGPKQYQIETSPARLAAQNVTLQQLTEAAEKANAVAGGGILERGAEETLLRISGRSLTLADLEETPVAWRNPRPVLLKDVADVRVGGRVRRGDGSIWVRDGTALAGGPAVILTVQKQPHADTLALDREIDRVLDQLQPELPAGVTLERQVFRQADFIRAAVGNIAEAIRAGGVWVFVVLFLFLWNLRTSLIALTARPLSLLITALVFTAFGVTLNTMTLGGLAVAAGELVDDAIVDVENIFRRLKENYQRAAPESPLRVIFLASSEVRGSIVYATLIVCLVVLPLFALDGVEGRLFAPLALLALLGMGGEFLPAFNEGTLTINVQAEPGTSLAQSNRLGRQVEELLLRVPEVVSVCRRTGRAEMDEHAEGVNSSEFDVRLRDDERPKPGWTSALVRAVPGLHRWGVEAGGRPRDQVRADIRDRVTCIPGVRVNVGQPIAHRLDRLLSGVRAQVAAKVFGPDLRTLRDRAHDVAEQILHPLAVVVVGGLLVSTLLDQVVTPALFYRFGRGLYQQPVTATAPGANGIAEEKEPERGIRSDSLP
jgi:Cu/Ag efflux pump CusA